MLPPSLSDNCLIKVYFFLRWKDGITKQEIKAQCNQICENQKQSMVLANC